MSFKFTLLCAAALAGTTAWAQQTVAPKAASAPGTAAAPAAQPAPVQVSQGWVRPALPGQGATGAFMTLLAPAGAKLVGASSAAAGVTELHEMKMDGNVMRMRAIAALELPHGQAVQLKPGGYHVMLMDLKAPLAQGTSVPLTLLLQDAQGRPFKLEMQLPVSQAAPTAPAPGNEHKH